MSTINPLNGKPMESAHVDPMYAVYDSKTELYQPPFVQMNDATAQRLFEQAVNNPTGQIHQSPEDYTLFRIGFYDADTGELIREDAHISLGNGIEFVKKTEEPKS